MSVPPNDRTPTERRPVDVEAEFRRRRQTRATVMALILGALVVLFYAISIAKMT